MGKHTFDSLRADYRRLWDGATVTKSAEARRQAQLINSHRATYEDVGKTVGAPWWVIGVLHLREAGEGDVGRWLCVLHNGEKIIGTGRKTCLVPEGRGPFTSFGAAAIDAFEVEGLKDRREWSECPVEFLAYVSEKFNGFGYRDERNMVSPYLWGGTSVQQRGKYIADHKFDENTMDPQIGTMAVLKSLQQLDPGIGTVAGRTIVSQGTASAPRTTPPPVASDLANLVVAAMERKGYQVDRGPGQLNIVYVEGMNPDGTPNNDEANKWNDLRLLIRFEGGLPKIVGKWAATTEPGRYWTENPLSPLGAARIAFGQYSSWQVGMHHADKPSGHEALVQTGGLVTVCRDLNKDGLRTGDRCQTGIFGINQHWGFDLAEVDKASAGCLVGQSKDGHREFMALVKSDPRYQANQKYVFATAVLPESDVLAEALAVAPPPAQRPPVLADASRNVRRWQKLLGFSEQEQDGIFSSITEEAVKRFQRRHGLVVTGDLDEKTRDLLEREATITVADAPRILKPVELVKQRELLKQFVVPGSPGNARPTEPLLKPRLPDFTNLFPNLATGVATMNPLIALAVGVLPEILKVVVGDKAGGVAGAVSQAVAQIAHTTDPEKAREKLNADPAAFSELQVRLAEIAAAQDEKRQEAQLALIKEQNEQEARRQQAQIAVLKEQYEQDAKKREAQLEQFRVQIEDTKSARSTFSALALANSPMAWGAPMVSLVVTLGFFGILIVLLTRGIAPGDQVAQIVNITVGALAAAFATVVSFWLGSSQGSRAKDASTSAAIETQARQTEALQSTLLQAQVKQAEVLQSTVKTAIATAPAKGPKSSNFRRSIDVVLANQGRFSGDTGDLNAVAQFGITIATLRDWRQDQKLAAEDVRNLGRDEACEIYRTRFWNVLRCDDLPEGVDLAVFDFGVSDGPARSAKMLQQVVGAAPDGSIGDATIAATRAMAPKDIIKEISDRRLDYYRDLPNGARMRDRAATVEKIALDMIPAERAMAA
ncbi:glycosyl hydrolase 108 family protein [Bradyrhizobium lablabi]|uniref:glycosyl hydrolase 108 family protein n=1 Tax=Bradyrhizobium lablabi TaxID=722472 RepID=UPI001BA6AA07|nr:glycosyl hydrolase 108 family protein [Bradyrhizobium lablabi]MBR0692937.1 peptidoglycan-binding protein [Bradyrhizobium lablabi]